MRKICLFSVLTSAWAFGAADFTCENAKYRLEIDSRARTASVTHKTKPGISFTTKDFEQYGKKIVRYDVEGDARVLRYEGTEQERWYTGQAYIATYATIVGDEIVYRAVFRMHYRNYFLVTRWENCKFHASVRTLID